MAKVCRKCAPSDSPKPLFDFVKNPKKASPCQKLF